MMLGDPFLYSYALYARQASDMVRRIYIVVTIGLQKVEWSVHNREKKWPPLFLQERGLFPVSQRDAIAEKTYAHLQRYI